MSALSGPEREGPRRLALSQVTGTSSGDLVTANLSLTATSDFTELHLSDVSSSSNGAPSAGEVGVGGGGEG